MEVHDARGGSHRCRAEQQIEDEIALEVIEEEPQDAFGPEAWIRSHEYVEWIAALAVEKIGDGMASRETVLERSVNPSGGDR